MTLAAASPSPAPASAGPRPALAPLRLVHDRARPPAAAAAVDPVASRRLRDRGDEALVRLAAGGRADAFSIVYARHRAGLYRYCLAMTGDAEDAADAAQDAWLRAFAAARAGRAGERPFRPWIYTIARNACIDRLRGRRRASVRELDEADLAPAPGPEQERAARAEVHALLADLARLPVLQRSGVLMRDLAGLDHDEIARELRVSVRRSRALTGDARAFLHDRRAGRAMACDDVRTQISHARQARNRRIGAHLEDCQLCATFERRRRAHRLSSLAVAPLVLLRGVLDRAAAWFASPAGAAAALPGGAGRGAATLAAAALVAAGGGAVATSPAGTPRPEAVRAAPHAGADAGGGATATGGSGAAGRRGGASSGPGTGRARSDRGTPAAPPPRPAAGAAPRRAHVDAAGPPAGPDGPAPASLPAAGAVETHVAATVRAGIDTARATAARTVDAASAALPAEVARALPSAGA